MTNDKIKIMVSSTVYGSENDLDQIKYILEAFGYEVIMSKEGNIYVHMDDDPENACIKAVENCDLFFGVIFPREIMNSEELIKSLLEQEENEQLEFREVVRKDAIGKTICAFLNNNGGQLLIGVSADKKVLGVEMANKIQSELENYLNKEILPETPIMVSIEKFENKQVVLVKVWAGSRQPYIFDGSIYFRRAASTVKANSSEISELIHKRQQTEIQWERQSAMGVELEDLDSDEIQQTIKEAIKQIVLTNLKVTL